MQLAIIDHLCCNIKNVWYFFVSTLLLLQLSGVYYLPLATLLLLFYFLPLLFFLTAPLLEYVCIFLCHVMLPLKMRNKHANSIYLLFVFVFAIIVCNIFYNFIITSYFYIFYLLHNFKLITYIIRLFAVVANAIYSLNSYMH